MTQAAIVETMWAVSGSLCDGFFFSPENKRKKKKDVETGRKTIRFV